MKKTHLREQLQTIKNNYALVQVSIVLIAQPDSLKAIKDTLDKFKDHPEVAALGYITYVFESDDLLKLATSSLRGTVLRNCVKEMFELLKLFGEEHGQADVIRAAPWYQVLRILRNCLSHDMRFHFNRYDLTQLPVAWSDLRIDESFQGKPVPDQLSRAKTMELMDDVIRYVEQHVD